MAKFYTKLNESLQAFIAEQYMFFVATAPAKGRINLSPKGMNTFRYLNPRRVAYLDVTGSGNETAAHVLENNRMTLMFCSFTDTPLILRLSGQGQVIRPRDPAWSGLYPQFEPLPGARQIFVLDIALVQTSCGFAVPLYEFKTERTTLLDWTEKLGEEKLVRYQHEHNQTSIDGLPTQLLED